MILESIFVTLYRQNIRKLYFVARLKVGFYDFCPCLVALWIDVQIISRVDILHHMICRERLIDIDKINIFFFTVRDK